MSTFHRASEWDQRDASKPASPVTATEAEWLRLKRQREQVLDDEVCPCVGPVMFTDEDLVRVCIKDANGGTCSNFTVKPFEECPRWPRKR